MKFSIGLGIDNLVGGFLANREAKKSRKLAERQFQWQLDRYNDPIGSGQNQRQMMSSMFPELSPWELSGQPTATAGQIETAGRKGVGESGMQMAMLQLQKAQMMKDISIAKINKSASENVALINQGVIGGDTVASRQKVKIEQEIRNLDANQQKLVYEGAIAYEKALQSGMDTQIKEASMKYKEVLAAAGVADVANKAGLSLDKIAKIVTDIGWLSKLKTAKKAFTGKGVGLGIR